MASRTTASHDETKPLVEFLERPKLELILPMALLFWKALFIRGVPWLTASAVLLWADWALVQFLHCVVWFWPHSKDKPRCHDSKEGRRWNPVCTMEWMRLEEDDVSALVRMARMGGTVILSLQHFAQVMWFGYLMGRYYVAKEQAGDDSVILRRASSRAFGGIFFGINTLGSIYRHGRSSVLQRSYIRCNPHSHSAACPRPLCNVSWFFGSLQVLL